MGLMIYAVAPAIEIDDRALKHVQAVIISKLRRGESFAFSWDAEPDVGEDVAGPGSGKHGSVWISPSSLLYFSYEGSRNMPLNPAWLTLLSREANSNSGLRVVPEPEAPPQPEAARPKRR
jgi:hypothetical protein